jgi:hypothetical protein
MYGLEELLKNHRKAEGTMAEAFGPSWYPQNREVAAPEPDARTRITPGATYAADAVTGTS